MTDPVPSKEKFKLNPIVEAADIAHSFIQYAYEQGMHEIGIDPIAVLMGEIDRLKAEIEAANAESFRRREQAVFYAELAYGRPQVPGRYTIEPHGDGHALYSGRDQQHHGFNLARITETTPDVLKLIEQALNGGASQPPAKEPSRELIDYGYAPGQYSGKCLDCKHWMDFVDKRCRVCKPCAEKRRDRATQPPGDGQ